MLEVLVKVVMKLMMMMMMKLMKLMMMFAEEVVLIFVLQFQLSGRDNELNNIIIMKEPMI
jgi:hypothetical protein